jgi:hypothetical protein
MTENETSAPVAGNSAAANGTVGCDAIDAYLNSVEQALITAGAPRADRLQVLQDLESQISDMLAQFPLPFTEEIVQSVIAKLEPPTHFAATYGNGKEPVAAKVRRSIALPECRWSMIAAAGCASILMGYVLLLLAAAVGAHGPVIGLIGILLLVGTIVTPPAIWQSVKQLRAEPATLTNRNLVLRSAVIYAAVVPTSLLLLACAATQGMIMIPIGIIASVYFQFLIVRRLWRRMNDTLPPQPTNNDTPARGAATPMNFSTALSAPAI